MDRYNGVLCSHENEGNTAICNNMDNTQKNYTKKCLSGLDNQDGVVILLDPDILECEVKWALKSITMNKASGCDRIPAETISNPER